MLVSYNEFENKASIVSFMRDSLVEVPGYGQTKLGHSYGGVGLTINTINKVYDLDIQNYVTINFENMQLRRRVNKVILRAYVTKFVYQVTADA